MLEPVHVMQKHSFYLAQCRNESEFIRSHDGARPKCLAETIIRVLANSNMMKMWRQSCNASTTSCPSHMRAKKVPLARRTEESEGHPCARQRPGWIGFTLTARVAAQCFGVSRQQHVGTVRGRTLESSGPVASSRRSRRQNRHVLRTSHGLRPLSAQRPLAPAHPRPLFRT